MKTMEHSNLGTFLQIFGPNFVSDIFEFCACSKMLSLEFPASDLVTIITINEMIVVGVVLVWNESSGESENNVRDGSFGVLGQTSIASKGSYFTSDFLHTLWVKRFESGI